MFCIQGYTVYFGIFFDKDVCIQRCSIVGDVLYLRVSCIKRCSIARAVRISGMVSIFYFSGRMSSPR
jgi:hypothetical protein